MATANEKLHDALVRRQVYLQRYGASLGSEIVELLNETEADLRKKIEDRLDSVEGQRFSARALARLQVVKEAIAELRGAAFSQARTQLKSELRDLAEAERDYIDNAIRSLAPVVLDTALPNIPTLVKLITSEPFQGGVMADWARSLERNDLDRIMQAIRIGMAQGESVGEIARRVIGTRSLNGRDGVTERTRHDALTVTRTAVSHVAGGARRIFLDANNDIITQEVYVATLDSRTTLFCATTDGKLFPLGEGPIPPVHWNCRSLRVAYLNADLIGDRPAAGWTERMLEGLTPRERRAKIRELTGPVPAKTTYTEFFKRQSAAFQRDVLGPNRYELYKSGKLSLDKFVDQGTGRKFTLLDLEAKSLMD